MTELIISVASKLDDPVMLEWAVHYYENLPDCAGEDKIAIETQWFHDVALAKLIGNQQHRQLRLLFRKLPPERLVRVSNLLLKHWDSWPTYLATAASRVLAANAPDKLAGLYLGMVPRLQAGNLENLYRLQDLDAVLEHIDTVQAREVAEALTATVLSLPYAFDRLTALTFLLKAGRFLSQTTLTALLASLLQTATAQDLSNPEPYWPAVFSGLFGKQDFLSLVFEPRESPAPVKLTDLTVCFAEGAPLATIEIWLTQKPDPVAAIALLATLGIDSKPCRRLLALLQDARIAAHLSAELTGKLALAACLHEYCKSDFDVSGLTLNATLKLLTFNIADLRWLEPVAGHLRTFPATTAGEGLILRLRQHPQNFATHHAISIMGRLGYPEFLTPLLEIIADDSADSLCEAAEQALIAIGRPAQSALVAQWDVLSWKQRGHSLNIIQKTGRQMATAFAAARFDELLADDVDYACEFFANTPTPELLPLLQARIDGKQPFIDWACYILSRLTGQDEFILNEVGRRVQAEHARVDKILHIAATGQLPQNSHLLLNLECPACGTVSEYRAKGVIIGETDTEQTEFLLADEFPCISCRTDVDFKFTSQAKLSVVEEMIAISMHANATTGMPPLIQSVQCRIDGVLMPLHQGLAIIKSGLRQNPDSAADWLMLATLLLPLNRPKALEAACRTAMDLAPNAADAGLLLAECLADGDKPDAAFAILLNALEHKTEWLFLWESADFSQRFANLYNRLQRSLGITLPVLHPAAISHYRKAGKHKPAEESSQNTA